MHSGYADISASSDVNIPVTPRAVGVKMRAGRVASNGSTSSRITSRKKPYPGIEGVIDYLTAIVAKYTGDERVRSKALEITKSVRNHPLTGQPNLRDADAVADTIYRWMVRNINYVRDPYDIERIQTPTVTLKQKAGDCDDHAVLSASLLQSLGIPTGFRLVSRSGREFDHIYTVYQNNEGDWKTFDTTVLKYAGYTFDERLIKRSRHVPNHMPDLGWIMESAALVQTAISGGAMLRNIFSAKDKDAREHRNRMRSFLIETGVNPAQITYGHEDNHILERYVQIILEFGDSAVNQLNTFGNLSPQWVNEQRSAQRRRKTMIYIAIAGGVIALTAGGVIIYNRSK
jgi:hypothetical protein